MTDPVRLLDSLDEPRLARALEQLRREEPSPEQLVSVRSAVLAQIALAPGVGAGATAGAGVKKTLVTKTLVTKLGLGVVASVSAALVLRAVLTPSVQQPGPASSAPAANSAPPLPIPPPPEPVASMPEPVASASPSLVASARAPRPPALDEAARERAETQLLDRAQQALGSDPATTLRLCDEHARSYPSGTLGLEREVLAIDALVRLGRRDEAERRATRFRTRHPSSAYLPRLAVILGR